MVHIGNDWDDLLRAEFSQPYYISLRKFLVYEYKTHTIYPPAEDIFNALRHTPLASVRAVILGQDPYHGAGQAHGLCFSVKDGVPLPRSLANIFKEMQSDVGKTPPETGNLTYLAKEGVLLLNTALTVREGAPCSHRDKGWEILTDRIISLVNDKDSPVVFLLWGAHAGAKRALITNKKHLVLQAPHPSPLSASRGFFGSKHFSAANAFLAQNGQEPIHW